MSSTILPIKPSANALSTIPLSQVGNWGKRFVRAIVNVKNPLPISSTPSIAPPMKSHGIRPIYVIIGVVASFTALYFLHRWLRSSPPPPPSDQPKPAAPKAPVPQEDPSTAATADTSLYQTPGSPVMPPVSQETSPTAIAASQNIPAPPPAAPAQPPATSQVAAQSQPTPPRESDDPSIALALAASTSPTPQPSAATTLKEEPSASSQPVVNSLATPASNVLPQPYIAIVQKPDPAAGVFGAEEETDSSLSSRVSPVDLFDPNTLSPEARHSLEATNLATSLLIGPAPARLPASPPLSPPSDNSSPSTSPSPPESPPPSPSRWAWVAEFLGEKIRYNFQLTFSRFRHSSKFLKYRHILNQLTEQLQRSFPQLQNLPRLENENLRSAWDNLFTTLTQPTRFENVDSQYVMAVTALRQASLLPFEGAHREFIKQAAYLRFAGVYLFNYCRDLMSFLTESLGNLPTDLSLGNFYGHLQERNQKLDAIDPEFSKPRADRIFQKLKGFLNIWFDPLLAENVPYVDGAFVWGSKKLRLLRHGTPVQQNDISGWVKWTKDKFGLDSSTTANALQITPDYEAFIEAAGDKKENILHVILENGGAANERQRVLARLALGKTHPNFFPLALRLDGSFFNRFTPDDRSEDNIIFELVKLILTPPSAQTESELNTNEFALPQKIIEQAGLTQEVLHELFREITQIYFPKLLSITTVKNKQALILLCYVHLVLYLCMKLNISILEALCKDDIDRGNVFKTVLKLHFLYLTGQITSENLLKVLINTLAPPVIVKKQAIIPDRAALIEPVLNQMKDLPPCTVKSILHEYLQSATYEVQEIANQGIWPHGPSVATWEEYEDLLAYHSEAKELSGITPSQHPHLFSRFTKDDRLLVPLQIGKEDHVGPFVESVLAHAGHASDLILSQLKGIFNNRHLGTTLQFDDDKIDQCIGRLQWKTNGSNSNLPIGMTFPLFFKVIHPNLQPEIPPLTVTVTMDDFKNGKATYQLSVERPATG